MGASPNSTRMPGSHWFLPPSTPCRPNSQHHSRFHHLPARAPSSTTVVRSGLTIIRQSSEQQPQTISYFIVSIVFILTCRFSFFLFFSLPSLPSLLSRLFIFFSLISLLFLSLILSHSYLLFLLPDLGHLHRHVMHQILTTCSVLLVPTLRPALRTRVQQAILICQTLGLS